MGIPKPKRNKIFTAADRRSSQPNLRPAESHPWQRRFYDLNLQSEPKRIEKLGYMHRNPLKRGLLLEPEQWQWSNSPSYAHHEQGLVKINQSPKTVMKVRGSLATISGSTAGTSTLCTTHWIVHPPLGGAAVYRCDLGPQKTPALAAGVTSE